MRFDALEIKKYYDMTQSRKLFLPFSGQYNNGLALASIVCTEQIQQGFNPILRIQGKLYHRLGNLLPPAGNDPKFAQIFFFDDSATKFTDRLRLSVTLDAEILRDFQDCLHNSNSDIQSFKSAIEILCSVRRLTNSFACQEGSTKRWTHQNLQSTNK